MSARAPLRPVAVLLAASFAATAWDCTPDRARGEGGVGTAVAAVTSVPAGVGCVAVTATAASSASQAFDVTPGQSAVFSLTVPVGTVRFDAAAYPTACGQVTPASLPTWAAPPVLAKVQAGQATAVALDLQMVGKGGVTVDFAPPTCSAGGAACQAGAECCSASCDPGGTCTAPAGCVQASDCPAASTDCLAVVCFNGTCAVSHLLAGTAAGAQTAGDCAKNVCDGAGGVTVTPDATDIPADDGSACTVEVCQAGAPTHLPVAAGTACTTGGGKMCDGAGHCLGCLGDTDCPGVGTECQTPICAAGTCGVHHTPAGTATSAQTAGDCAKNVCDGNGGFATVADATDLPADDGNPCTVEVCQAGAAAHVPVAAGTACATGGGHLCDGAGHCVACLGDADCPAGYTCAGGACAAPTCSDAHQNGGETDVDCGGPTCPPCAAGKVCLADTDCVATAYCAAGTCAPKAALGAAATSTRQCLSGFVADGVCCDTSCASTCFACTAAKKGAGPDGLCGPIHAGADPDAECAGKVCDGAGACVTPPSVVATSPADGAVVVAGANIAVTFNQAMSPATITGQSAAGPCAGTIQVSLDGFATCVAFPAPPSWNAAFTAVTLTAAPGLLVDRSYKIRVTTGARDAVGMALPAAYTASAGFTTTSAPACAATLVISQIYTGGGLTGATYQNDFVELHNRGSSAVPLAGFSLQISAAKATTWTVVPLSGSIPAGGYYLVKLFSAATKGSPLPPADLTSTIDLQLASGKVALVSSTTALPATCPPVDPQVVDFVDYGGSNCLDDSPAPYLTAKGAALRNAKGCLDSNVDGVDFTFDTPAPRSSATPAYVCSCTLASVQNESDAALEADFCSTRTSLPAVMTGTSTPATYGRLFEPGTTGLGSANPNVRAQLGYGPLTANPEYEAGWTWFDATYNASCSGCGSQDEYAASFTAPAPGTYAYAYRFSLDLGQTWTLCDLAQGDGGSGSGAGLTFDLQNLGQLVVTP